MCWKEKKKNMLRVTSFLSLSKIIVTHLFIYLEALETRAHIFYDFHRFNFSLFLFNFYI